MTPLKIMSLGAGVQSSTLLLMCLRGDFERPDAAIFADTGWEPREVYVHLERLKAECEREGLPLHVVNNGNIRDTTVKDFFDAPFYMRWPDGTGGMARRQCTHQLKQVPIRRKVRELMAERGIAAKPGAVEQWLGISMDEVQRMKPADVKFVTHRFPLVEARMTRHDCKLYLERVGWNAPRSACIGCPYHSDDEWRKLRDEQPEEFADAVKFELEVQQADRPGLDAMPFLHRQRVPLDLVDLATKEDAGQLAMTWDDECEGMCGV